MFSSVKDEKCFLISWPGLMHFFSAFNNVLPKHAPWLSYSVLIGSYITGFGLLTIFF